MQVVQRYCRRSIRLQHDCFTPFQTLCGSIESYWTRQTGTEQLMFILFQFLCHSFMAQAVVMLLCISAGVYGEGVSCMGSEAVDVALSVMCKSFLLFIEVCGCIVHHSHLIMSIYLCMF